MLYRIDFELGWVEYPLTAKLSQVGDRLLPPQVRATFPSDSRSPALHLLLAVVDGVPQCREVRVVAKEGQRGVQTSDLRAVQLEDFIEQLFAMTASRILTDGGGATVARHEVSAARQHEAALAVRRARASGRRKITEEFLQRVAETYRDNLGSRPTESVRQVFGVSHRTAADYVHRARLAGILPKTTAGKSKA